MAPTPIILVSAVSRELKTARQLVANTLQHLGYAADWQDIFGMEQGNLLALLRRKVDESSGVIQIVGHRYGAEPTNPDPVFGRVSYTQYEARYARQRNKKVWYILLATDFPTDLVADEPTELAQLQAAYRLNFSGTFVYQEVHNKAELEATVLKLRNDLAKLRRGIRAWAMAVSAALLLILGIIAWLSARQSQLSQNVVSIQQTTTRTEADMSQERAAVVAVLKRANESEHTLEILSPRERFELAIEAVAQEQHESVDELRSKINLFVETIDRDPAANLLDKARAALARQQNDVAAQIGADVGIEAKHQYDLAANALSQVAKKREEARETAYEAFYVEAQAEQNATKYSQAIESSQQAIGMTDPTINVDEWCDAEMGLGICLCLEGKYSEAGKEFRAILAARQRSLGLRHPDTLIVRDDLAMVLMNQNEYAEAVEQFTVALSAQQEKGRPEPTLTLDIRNGLAAALEQEGDYVAAEADLRAGLLESARTLGPDHPCTLTEESNLAMVLSTQGKYAEAEPVLSRVLESYERHTGADDKKTLRVQFDLAWLHSKQGNYEQAATELRQLSESYQRVLGADNAYSLTVRKALANVYINQGKYGDAELQLRDTLAVYDQAQNEKLSALLMSAQQFADDKSIPYEWQLRGSAEVDSLRTRSSIAYVLDQEGKFAEAVEEERKVLTERQQVLGVHDPSTLECYVNLSWYQLMARNFHGALATIEAGKAAGNSSLELEANRAHALLLLGRKLDAEQIYLGHDGQKIETTGQTWTQMILDDFDQLEKQGIATQEIASMRSRLTVTTAKP